MNVESAFGSKLKSTKKYATPIIPPHSLSTNVFPVISRALVAAYKIPKPGGTSAASELPKLAKFVSLLLVNVLLYTLQFEPDLILLTPALSYTKRPTVFLVYSFP